MADQKKKSLMATSKSKSTSVKSDSGLSATLLAGSEEIFDFVCMPCITENIHLEAVGYCQNCGEYLCDTCYKCHRKTAAARHHKLLDKADMPKSKVVVPDDLKERCPKHQDKLIDYFCNSHSDLCCITCLNVDHGSCKVISHIPDVSDGIASGNEFTDLMAELKAQVSVLTKQQEMLRLSTKDNDKYQAEALAGIRDFRKEVDKMLDKYEEDAVMKVSKLHFENSEKMQTTSSKVQVMLSDLTAIIGDLDAKAKGNKNNQLFVDIKMSRQRLSVVETAESHASDSKITRYGFHQDVKIKEMLSTLSAVWSLSIKQDGEETKARYLGEVNVKADDDKDDCTATGIAILPGDDIAMIDFKNQALKLVDITLNKVKSRISLSSAPGDITIAKPNEVAVSLGTEGKIEIYTVTNVLSRSNTIHVGEFDFYGICYAEDRFIVTYFYKGLVKIVDMSGRVLSTISTYKNGDRLFTKPRYIAVGRYGDVVYVTDMEAHTVTTVTLSGYVISIYRNDKLNPRGVTVGPDHKVYVCSCHTNTVLQLTATGEFQQVLLDEHRGLSTHPGAIVYDATRNRLYISSLSSWPGAKNYVKFFQLE